MKDSTIQNIIEKCANTFISYIDENNYPVTKAMLKPRKMEGIKTFYLSTNTSSNKVKCLLNNSNASLYFVDKRFYRGISLVGTAEILTTQEAKEMIWQENDTMYYHGGVTDPDYCVIKFTATAIRVYSNFHSEDYKI